MGSIAINRDPPVMTTFRRARKIAILGAVGIVALVAALWLTYSLVLLRGPLAGETVHDFGVVAIDKSPVRLEHTFHLTNRMNEPVTVRAVKPDCGCVAATPELKTIAPGEAFDLPIAMNFAGKSKTVLIHLDLGDAGRQILKVKVQGHLLPQLTVNVPLIELRASEPASVTITAHIYGSDDQPDPPTIISQESTNVSFGGWRLKWRPKDNRVVPVEWIGELRIDSTEAALSSDASITVQLKPASDLVIPIKAGGEGTLSTTQPQDPASGPESPSATAPRDR